VNIAEYDKWSVAYRNAFPSVNSWLNGYNSKNPDDVVTAARIEAIWFKTLSGTDLRDAMMATEYMTRNIEVRPDTFDDTAAYVAAQASKHKHQRLVAEDARTSQERREALSVAPVDTWEPPEIYRHAQGQWCYTSTEKPVDPDQYGQANGKPIVQITDAGRWEVLVFGKYQSHESWPNMFRYFFEAALGLADDVNAWSPDDDQYAGGGK
jgi:hypothetical protein